VRGCNVTSGGKIGFGDGNNNNNFSRRKRNLGLDVRMPADNGHNGRYAIGRGLLNAVPARFVRAEAVCTLCFVKERYIPLRVYNVADCLATFGRGRVSKNVHAFILLLSRILYTRAHVSFTQPAYLRVRLLKNVNFLKTPAGCNRRYTFAN